MTNVEYWQEQERRAAEILPIVEQILVIVQNQNLLERTQQGWCYWGEEQTLIYDPESEQLSIVAKDSSWQLDWHEGLFVPLAETHITDEQLAEFRELARWLETQEEQTPQNKVSEPQAEMLLSNAAELFEYYASQGDTAFKFSPDSTEHFYRVQIENEIFLISRDDASGLYSLQREDGASLSAIDMQIWDQMETWLQQLAEQSQIPMPHAAAPYWEQQTIQANALLLDAQTLFDFYQQTNRVEYNPGQQDYRATIEDYTLGYHPASDMFWLERKHERLVSATHYQQHRDRAWHLTELHDLGNIAQEDIRRLREWCAWLIVQDESEQAQQITQELVQDEPDYVEQRLDYDLDR